MSFILTIPIENLKEIEYNYNLLVFNLVIILKFLVRISSHL